MASLFPSAISLQRSINARRIWQSITALLIVGLCVINLLLIKQNRDLKAAIVRSQPEFLKPGQHVPPFAGKTLAGGSREIDYAASNKTILLVFASQCPACVRALPYWRQIKESSDQNQYQMFGISLDNTKETDEFLKANGLKLDVFVGVGPQFRTVYKLNLTPLTIVIDSSGTVEKIWPGAFNAETGMEMEKYFGLSPN